MVRPRFKKHNYLAMFNFSRCVTILLGAVLYYIYAYILYLTYIIYFYFD